uniref:Uncharacterized protein n=1 Tax=Avena sativa TaxID=4498 RepID=A0ACD5V103_AVESA
MELLLLILSALVLLGLSVLIRPSSSYITGRRRRAPAPAVALHTISDPAVAHHALVEDAGAAFSNRPVPPFFESLAKRQGVQRNENVSSAPYGPHWRVLRRNITAETLHPSRLAGHIAPLQTEAIQGLVAALRSAATEPRAVAVVVREHLEAAVYGVVVRLCFGQGAVDECQVRAMCSATKGFQLAIGAVGVLRATVTRLAHWRQQRRLFACHDRLAQLCLPLIAARRRRNDLDADAVCRPYVDSFAHIRVPDDDGGQRALTDDEMVSLVLEFLGAGAGPVVACLEWTLAHLVAQPDVQEKLRREVEEADRGDRAQKLIRGMPYLHAVVLESLRMHPPVPVAARFVKGDAAAAAIARHVGKSDDLVVMLFLLGDMGRDSKTWKDPDEFRPERFLPGGEAESVGPLPGRKETRMMPFGAGHRFCPGVGLAMTLIKSFLAALVREFEWAPPPTDAAVDLTELDGFLKTMKKQLSARLTPRRT